MLTVALCSCDRSEADRNGASAVVTEKRTAEATPSSSPNESPSTSPAKTAKDLAAPAPDRCIVPMADAEPRAAAPATNCPVAPSASADLPRGWVTFPDAPGAPRVAVEVANEAGTRERGLMYRTELGDDAGMIFSWPEERIRTFWMRNTCLSLDMLFIAQDGTIVGILEHVPTMNDAPRRIPCPAAHVLELKAGWARGHGVAPGQRIVIDT